ncbi:hypothetical protein [Verrucomicrobium spinosum]|uniref:hypothetical protein n=1 Tax=Verrucomicrobium spinosum TaxID=2736 RepID=UPI000AAEA4BD|nr:hypothetical protein [Verrucomicrobium spinosum]
MMGFKEAEPAAPSLFTGAQTRTGLRPRPQPQVPAPQPLGLAALKKPAYLQRTEISEKAERPKPTGEVQGPMAQSTFQKMKEQATTANSTSRKSNAESASTSSRSAAPRNPPPAFVLRHDLHGGFRHQSRL